MSRTLYVYYRVQAAQLPDAVAAVRALHARLRAQWPSLQATLHRRPGESAGEVTVMEVYAAHGGIDAGQQARIEAEAATLSHWLAGPRHTEVFVPVD
jgi:hypothetical protein